MNATDRGVTSLTAGDLMSREVVTVGADRPLPEAAAELARRGVRGAPAVDPGGHCVGVLSVSDVARWAAGRGRPGPGRGTCGFQVVGRAPGGDETVLCLLEPGACPAQRVRAGPGGAAVVCDDPRGVPTDWQVVDDPAAADRVRDVMTTDVVAVAPTATVTDLARVMLDRGVHRVFVLDGGGRPVGVVAADDLLQVLANLDVLGGR